MYIMSTLIIDTSNNPLSSACRSIVNGNYLYTIVSVVNGRIDKRDLSGNIVEANWATIGQFNGPTYINSVVSYKNYLYFAIGGNNLQQGIWKVTINSDGTYGGLSLFYARNELVGVSVVNDTIYYANDGYVYSVPTDSSGNATSETQLFNKNIRPVEMHSGILGLASYKSKHYIFMRGLGKIMELNLDGTVNNAVWCNSTSINNGNSRYTLIGDGNYIYIINDSGNLTQVNLDGTVSNQNWFVAQSVNMGILSIANGYLYLGYSETIYITPLPPPPILYAKIKMNYSSVVNGNSVGGLVFEGYYSYQSNNNNVTGFYSSTDMSTNLIIPSTDPFVTGALTLLGKTSANTSGSTGMNTASTHAGIFVKNLPFVNALFKSNPYVLLSPSGCVMFDNYGVVNANVLATSYFTNKYVMSNGNVYSNKNNSFLSFSNFTFTYNTVSALPTVNTTLPLDYTFFNSIKQIKYNAKYNGAVLLDSYFVFYLDSSNNYHMCAQYPTTTNKNVLLFSDASCDNFPNTGNFGNTLGTVNPDPTVTTIVAVSGNAATATVTTSAVSATGTPTVTSTVTAVGAVARVNLNALNSNICFSEGSIVTTDQGDVEIQNIDIHYHTICQNKIIALTETQSVDDYLVKIKKDAFGNIPTQDTETTGNHMIFNGLSMVRAKTLINNDSIEKIPYHGLPLYNILLDKHDVMSVNGLVCETLNPENPIAKYYVMMAEHPENKIEMENMWRKRTQEIIHPVC